MNEEQVNHPSHYNQVEEPQEEWIDIPGYEGLYKISNLGNVLSLNYRNTKFPNIMSIRVGKRRNNYCDVILSKHGVHKRPKIHQLVAMAFIPNPYNYAEVNHIDENPMNNAASNLEWCSRSYNTRYGKRPEKYREKRGARVQKLSLSGVVLDEYPSVRFAAKENGLHNTNIFAALNGKQKTCGGFLWKKV